MPNKFTQEEVLKQIINSKSIAYDLDDLRFPFGFKRVDGKEFLFIKLFSPTITEEQVSYVNPLQLHINIETWCKENNIKYAYDINTDRYYFTIFPYELNAS